jgi:hypothetical protein
MPLEIKFGMDAVRLKEGAHVDITWRETDVVNPHILMVGMSGAGKTHNLRRIVRQLVETSDAPIRIHIFDIHGDIDVPEASTVMFSEQTSYGLNPLIINPDQHHGGVRKRIQSFISILNRSRSLGSKQENIIRNLLTDLYVAHGFRLNNPETWLVSPHDSDLDAVDGRLFLDVPFSEKEDARALNARWDNDHKGWWVAATDYDGPITRWPPRRIGRRHLTMNDLLNHARTVQKRVFLGANQRAVIALESFQRAARSHHKKMMEALKRSNTTVGSATEPRIDQESQAAVEKAGQKAIEAYREYICAVKTGSEFDDYIRYDSAEVLKSVVDRLENLNSIGIFRSQMPPFDPAAPVWRYHLKALSMEERKLFVLFRLEEIFMAALQRGEQQQIRDIVILDEAHAFHDDDAENIINTIAREARKFGLGMIAASQSPTHFTEDFLTSVGTKVCLAIDEMFWDGAARKLRLDVKALEWIKPRRTCAVQIKATTESKNAWRWVVLPQTQMKSRELESA